MSNRGRKPRSGVSVSELRDGLPALAPVSEADLRKACCIAIVDGGFDTVPLIVGLPTWPRSGTDGRRLAMAFIDRVQGRTPIHG
jgi:hypothetical protein